MKSDAQQRRYAPLFRAAYAHPLELIRTMALLPCIKIASIAVLITVVSGCTAVYHRSFAIEPRNSTPVWNSAQVFEQLRQFLRGAGYRLVEGENEKGKHIAFEIRSVKPGFLPTSRLTDSVGFSLLNSTALECSISRISSSPFNDFSEKYMSEFASVTERLLFEASGQALQLRAIAK
ncbi:MAG: hypothetical protein KIT18_01165 [Burkholderiales bacterium]|nr:hypothetical protein [Burkholderiales bacterium]